MAEPQKPENTTDGGETLKEKLGGLGQEIIGEIEKIGGVLTGDPNTVAEGEFNVEVGEIREEIEEAQDEK